MLTTKLKSFDSIATMATTSSSLTFSLTGFGLLVIPISSSIACGLTISHKILYDIVMQKYNKYRKQYEKEQQTIKFFIELFRKSLQDNAIARNEYKSLCNIFTKYLDETKNETFFTNMIVRIKLMFCINIKLNKLKFNLEPRT